MNNNKPHICPLAVAVILLARCGQPGPWKAELLESIVFLSKWFIQLKKNLTLFVIYSESKFALFEDKVITKTKIVTLTQKWTTYLSHDM